MWPPKKPVSPVIKIFRLITSPVYQMWKADAIEKIRAASPIISYPLLIWVKFNLDTIYWQEGAEAAQNALLKEVKKQTKDRIELLHEIIDPKPNLFNQNWICVNLSDLLNTAADLRTEIAGKARPGDFFDCEPGQRNGIGIALEIDEAQAWEWMKRGQLRFYQMPAGTEKWVLFSGDPQ